VDLVTDAKMFTNGKESSEERISSVGPIQNKRVNNIAKPMLPFKKTVIIIDLGITTSAFLISSAAVC